MGKREVSVSRVVAAPPEKIFELLVDPRQHPLLDGSGTVREAHPDTTGRLELGAKFGMDMKMGAPYKILNTVVEFEENRLIAWRHFNGHRWRWQLEPLEDGTTRVTETFDWSTAKMPVLIGLSFFPRKNKRGMERSLVRLAEMVEL
ncbi:SRPBCC family protein [Haloechinothrix sp. YIM 98757]|uniref:SRPBCC family protein n=1 Tax=Haloechinothrix aidingensis TaxID=2752311 RepID=A0A837ZZN0_9PSEU|nr:SRPBCC family protein [Haloechinothrix aidingensis]MBA0125704.1 SRPBCC family protein [Haloechinothrix aidingensis]